MLKIELINSTLQTFDDDQYFEVQITDNDGETAQMRVQYDNDDTDSVTIKLTNAHALSGEHPFSILRKVTKALDDKFEKEESEFYSSAFHDPETDNDAPIFTE